MADRVEAKAEMLIRRPVAEVFEAFANPAVTSKFWFTRGSGRLEPGRRVRWEWEMFGASADVEVKEIEKDRRIVISWDSYGAPALVEWTFTARPDRTTFVSIVQTGFSGTPEVVADRVRETTEGFALVLCGCKALLEHNIELNLIRDRYPEVF